MAGVGIVSIGNILEEQSGRLSGSGSEGHNNAIGISIGLANTFVNASYLVVCRYLSSRLPEGSGLLGLLLFGPFSSLVGLTLGGGAFVAPSDAWLVAVQGGLMLPVGFAATATATRYLLTSEVSRPQPPTPQLRCQAYSCISLFSLHLTVSLGRVAAAC
jgi:hypothetical protein